MNASVNYDAASLKMLTVNDKKHPDTAAAAV